jgi:hypothetical protein
MGHQIRQFAKSNVSVFGILLFSLLSLLPGAVCPVALAQPPRVPSTAVLLKFSTPVPEGFWQTLKTDLEGLEASGLMREPPFWLKQEEFYPGMDFPEIVQVRLEGDCWSGEQHTHGTRPGPLGWVYQVEGRIQPFVFVDCNRITKTLEGEVRGKTAWERREKLARAISRVIAHELIHIGTQDARHREQKPYLSSRELAEDLRHRGEDRASPQTLSLSLAGTD